MPNLLIFAGTTEGRELLEALSRGIGGSGLSVYACVATDYGKELLPEGLVQIHVRAGRMTEQEMVDFMEEKRFDSVIDTTHPYARLASENIRAACKRAGCEYIRVLRPSGVKEKMDCLFFGSHEEAAHYLNEVEGNALLTVGSKELSRYTGVRDYQKRLFPRVLPMAEVVESCCGLGFRGKQLICMQGPFTAELNAAMIRQTGARYVVTKDSGETGGFFEKYQAAVETGAELLVIGREQEDEGISPEDLLNRLEAAYQITVERNTAERRQEEGRESGAEPGGEQEQGLGQWFPFFINLSGKTVVVIGAGKIAQRRIETLLKFDCRLRVIAGSVLAEVASYAEAGKLELRVKAYEDSDLEGADYVLAATNDRQINHKIYEACRTAGVSVNVADDKGKSDFYFPGIIRKNGITVGVTAEGRDHALAKKATGAIRGCLERELEPVD